MTLTGDLHAPAAARRFAASALADMAGAAVPPRHDDVMLVVSELVTNSVRAGATAITVELDVSHDRVELRVGDDAAGWPTPQHPGWEEAHGRGLAIVEEIADDWHATSAGRGKRITATWSRSDG
jgi:anti-sigma regulatory factor (Ser/Thr protein kinase)